MEENPNNSDNIDTVKFMLEQRTRETTLHLRTYALMLAVNLSAFAAAFAFLTQSDEPVRFLIRSFIGGFGLFLAFCWWAAAKLDLNRIGLMTAEIQKLTFRSQDIPEELERVISTRIDLAGNEVDLFDTRTRIYTLHLPTIGFGVAWVFVSMTIGPGGLLA